MNSTAKIRPEHLRRQACVYVRQSTLHQVREHTASAEAQYGLVERAKAFGWTRESIQVYDRDLGVSGGADAEREDFRQLVADVGLAKIGIVLALDVTRFARNNADWYRLLDLCGVCDTLIADTDGVYDLSSYNDRLLLGMKGTMSEAEHHLIKARLTAGIERRSRAGKLRKRLPVGLEYDDQGDVQLTPDESVRHAIQNVFQRYVRYGTAYRAYRSLQNDGMQLPSRPSDEIGVRWMKARYCAVLGILKNPQYAGAYAYGKRRQVRYVDEEGRIRIRSECLPIEEWKVLIKDHHPGYINWEQYVENQQRLKESSLAYSQGEGSKVIRKGHALLQGLIRCGKCGRRMTTIYAGKGDTIRHVCNRASRTYGEDEHCHSIGGSRLQKAVVEVFLEALSPASMKVTVAALERMANEEDAVMTQLTHRRDEAEYLAARAQRQFDKVEPENRLVARTLESEWDARLRELAEIEQQIEQHKHQQPPPLTAEERARLIDIGLDLRRIWEAPTTENEERKQLLRAAFDDVVVKVDRDARIAHVTLVWQGGAVSEIDVKLPRIGGGTNPDESQLIEEMRRMAEVMTDTQIAGTLNRRAIRTATGLPFTVPRVRDFRRRHRIPEYTPSPNEDDEPTYTAVQAAEKLGVSNITVLRWLREGFLLGEQVAPRAPWRIKASSLIELKTARQAPKGWLPPKEAAKELGVSLSTVLHWARTGKIDTMMAGTGRRRGLRVDVKSAGCKAQQLLRVHT